MKLLADENFPMPVVRALRAAGWDVEAIAEENPTADDLDVLKRATADARVLLTFDLDFGEMLVRQKMNCLGAVIFRLPGGDRTRRLDRAIQALTELSESAIGSLTIVEWSGLRRRPLDNE